MNTEDKTYRENWLKHRPALSDTEAAKTIAGYHTTALPYSGTDRDGSLANLGGSNAILYVAQDLVYPVPENIAGAQELLMVKNNHIVLGMKLMTTSQINGVGMDTVQQEMFSIEAASVEKASLPATEFMLPADYSFQKPYEYGTDSTTTIDSATTSVKQAPKKKTKKGKVAAQKSKGSAIRRKKQ